MADSQDAADYRSRVTDSESASMWQSMISLPGYKSGYCVAVCPAGEDVLGEYLDIFEFEYGNRSVYDECETDRFPVSVMV
ncbi:hypothetical protein [Streptomyces camelliae]|uniref:hypothetical protein n=1 Tax=Streptomyces camelliae TaxID=3004093 RepID=UPI003D16FBC5